VRVIGSALVVLCVFYMMVRGHILLALKSRFSPAGLLRFVTDRQAAIARKIFLLCGWFTRFRMSVDLTRLGRLPDAFLLVSNHQSLIDIAVLMATLPGHVRFVTKRELGLGIPYVSLALRVGGHALISRTGEFRRGRTALRRIADRSAEGVCPVVFPEGTRSRDGKMRPFLAGAFRIILDHRPLPVLSVAMDGGYKVGKLFQILANLDRTRYRVKALSLHAAPKGKRQILELLSVVEAEIRAQIDQWHREDAGQKKTRFPDARPGERVRTSTTGIRL
jgi:1-acyl-sn-glycerol-3-phosphate acyltransferase